MCSPRPCSWCIYSSRNEEEIFGFLVYIPYKNPLESGKWRYNNSIKMCVTVSSALTVLHWFLLAKGQWSF
jgi:hypothetical protein